MNQPTSRKPDLLGRLGALCKGLPTIRCAIVHPCDVESVAGAHEAAKAGLIDPVLVGPQARIAKALDLAGIAGAMPIIATEHSHAAAARAVAMGRAKSPR